MAASTLSMVRRSSVPRTKRKSRAKKSANRSKKKKVSVGSFPIKLTGLGTISRALKSTLLSGVSGPHIAEHAGRSSSSTSPYLDSAIKSAAEHLRKHVAAGVKRSLYSETPMCRSDQTPIELRPSDIKSFEPSPRIPIDVTTFGASDHDYKIGGLRRQGAIELKIDYSSPVSDELARAINEGKPKPFKVNLHDTEWEFDGYVTNIKSNIDNCDVTIQPTGPMKEKSMAVFKHAVPTHKAPKTIRNRFYVAHPKVTTDVEQGIAPQWTKSTLEEAVAHARKILDKNPTQEHCAIVQIIEVVRAGRRTVRREKVRGKA